MTYAKVAASVATQMNLSNTPHNVTVETATALIDLLVGLGCPNQIVTLNSSGTLPRKRETIAPLQSSII